MKGLFRTTKAACLAFVTLGATLGLTPAKAESTLRVAMTAGDIPDVTGQPDQGFEGYRFVGYTLYDSLILWDLSKSDKEASLMPGLATKWYIDPANSKRWIFELRDNVAFHDGCKFDAETVVWNVKRLTDEKVSYFNPKQYAAMRTRTVNIDHAEVVDPLKVAILTKEPDSLFYIQMSFWMMISKCQFEKAGSYEAYAKMPSGTGPYKFDKMVPRERLELVQNTKYWNPARVPKHERLVLLPMPEATTRAAALLSGQVDFIEAPSPDTIPRLKSSGMTVITLPYPHNWHYQFNFVEGPFKDLKVRQAANYAMNRDEMVEMLGGLAQPGYATVPPSSPYFGKPVTYKYDMAKATALLKEAKCYPCEVTLAISTSGSGQMQPLPMNELVKAQMEAVGFKVKLEVMDWNALLDVTFKGREKFPNYHAVNVSRATQDPFSGIFRFAMKKQNAPAGGNWGHYYSAEIEKLIVDIYNEFDEVKRDAMIIRVHEVMNADAAMLFVTHDLNPRALSPKLKGFVQAQSWFQDLTPITVGTTN
ncbi:MAG: ABC transporter substrate-binding protein [Rhizobiales bacterium PAR1]|nr:MAG: ABC transporter substrate-binding protein [Rhizobiales bacterium PAR1]